MLDKDVIELGKNYIKFDNISLEQKILENHVETFRKDHFIHDTNICCYQLSCMVAFTDTTCHITLQSFAFEFEIMYISHRAPKNKMGNLCQEQLSFSIRF